MTDIYQIKMYLINLSDELSEEEIKLIIENAFDRNSLCAIVKFDEILCKDIGEWSDENKFNFSKTDIEEYRKEF